MDILITGAAGYIGGLAIKKFVENNNVLALDKKEFKEKLKEVKYFQLDLVKDNWEEEIGKVDIVIHCAFDIKSRHGRIEEQYFNNIECCNRVFEYCFKNNITKLIYLSSAAAYGAKAENIGKLLKETDPLTENIYPYGSHKREVEENFLRILERKNNSFLKSYFLRLATVDGKVGKQRKNNLLSFIKKTPILPYADKGSARQYINEEDVISAIEFLINKQIDSKFEVFNLAPPDFLTLQEMAGLQGKKAIRIPKWLVCIGFWLNWYLLLGKIFATVPGSDRSYIYPSNLDGNKITQYGFGYKYNSKDTFLGKN